MRDVASRTAVVGGGLLGMRLAQRLARAGNDVTLFEAAPDLGGLASGWQLGDITWDRHYHVIVPSDRRTLGLMAELGLAGQVRWHSVPAGCATAGVVHPATTPWDVARLPFLDLSAKARLALTAVRAASVRDPRLLDGVSAVQWLRWWSGLVATDRFWLPLLRSKLGDNIDIASAVFIATTIHRLVTARRAGAAGDGFGYVVGGYASVIDRLTSRLEDHGVTSRLEERVTGVRRRSSELVVTTHRGESTYDTVVVTVASPLAAQMCPDLSPAERGACGAVTYQGIVCLCLLLSERLTRNYITYLMDPAPFTAVIDMSALASRDELRGHGLVYLPAYVRSDDPLLAADKEAVSARFLPALRKVYPEFRGDVLASRLSAVRFVLPVPTVGYTRRLPPVRTTVPGLYFVSSALITDGTLNVDETLGVADRALPLVLGRAA